MELDTFVRDVHVEVKGTTLSIHQAKVGDVGCVVWDAALVLANYLQTDHARKKYVLHRNIVELGSGTGIVGLASAACGAREVVLTDLSEMMSLLLKNIEENRHLLEDATVQAVTYKWGSKEDFRHILKIGEAEKCVKKTHGFDTVIIADCVYYEDAVESLAQSINDLILTGSKNVSVLCSYEERDTTNKRELQDEFRRILTKKFKLKICFVPYSEMHHEFRSHDIHIFRVTKGT